MFKKTVKASLVILNGFFFFGFTHACSANLAAFIMPPIKYKTFEEMILGILTYLQGLAGLIAVIFIIIGGIMYMFSMGNTQRMERAKKTVTYALVGLVIVVAAPSFLKEITIILGGSTYGIAAPSLTQILTNVLMFLLSVVGSLSIISMLVGSFMFLTAYGDSDRAELGKKTVKYSIIGTIIALSSLLISQQIVSLLDI